MKKNLLILVTVALSLSSNAQWQITSGPSGAGHISALTIKDTTVFAGTETGGMFISTDNGNTWTQSNSGLTNQNEVKALIADNTYVFAGIGNSLGGPAVFSSVNDGASWTSAGLSFIFFWSFAMKPGYLVAGTWDGVSVSTNSGGSWNSFITGLPSNASVAALAYSGTKLFCGVSSSSVGGTGAFYSTNNGTTWNAFNTGLTNAVVNQLAVIGTSYVFAGTPGGIFRSATSTAGWSAVNTGLTSTNIKSLITVGNDLFTGATGGVFYSSNNGTNWSDVSTGLPPGVSVYSLASDSLYLYAGTDTAVYRRPLSEVVAGTNDLNDLHYTMNVFPNPTSREFVLTIGYTQSAVKKKYMVSIYNIYGEKMSERFLNGENKARIDVSELAAGIYFIRVTGDEKQLTGKIVVE